MAERPARTDRGSPAGAAFAVALIALPVWIGSAALDDARATTPDTPADYVQSLSGSYLAARVAQSSRDLGNASVFFQKALEADPDNLDLLERAFSLTLADGDFEKAIEFAETLIEANRQNRFARLTLGVKAMKERSFAGASGQFNRILEGAPSELTASLLAGWALLGANKTDEALALIDSLKGPEWYEVFKTFHGGMIADLAGQKETAKQRLAAAHELDSGAMRIVEAYARSLARNDEADAAKKVLSDFIEQFPNHPMPQIRQGLADLAAGITPAPLVRSAQEGAGEVLYGLGSAIGTNQNGADELAATYLHLALYLDPKADRTRLALGSLYEQMEKYERAVSLFGAVSPDSLLKRNAEIRTGLNYNQLDQLDEARSHLRALVDSDPSDLEAVRALGSVLREHKKFKDAAEVYTLGIDSLGEPIPGHWWLYYVRGIAFERTDQWPKAEADFLKALELEPDQPLVLNYLGYSWVDMGMRLDEALGMLHKAVEQRPTDGYIVDSLGWVFYKLGQYEKAVKELERAVELKPDDPIINDHLGDAYWKVGRKLEATFQWSHARDMDPEPEELKKILRKIEVGLETATTDRAEAPEEDEDTTSQ
ncbi:MAG: tetratricopeptide repeat protein [Pseudomonadota bacterium]